MLQVPAVESSILFIFMGGPGEEKINRFAQKQEKREEVNQK